MRSWRVVSVVRITAGKFGVLYIIGEDERHHAIVSDQFGLEKALTDTGVMLASLPPRPRAKIGVNENQ